MIRKIACAVGLLFASSAFLLTATDLSAWKNGIVISADVSGQGLNPANNPKGYRGESDIWWTYRIKAECFSYSVASRRTPSQAGLQPDHPIRFREEKSKIHILDRDGNPLALKIVRKDKSEKCRASAVRFSSPPAVGSVTQLFE